MQCEMHRWMNCQITAWTLCWIRNVNVTRYERMNERISYFVCASDDTLSFTALFILILSVIVVVLSVCRARSFDFHTHFVSLLKDEFLEREENGSEKEGNGKIGKEKLKKNIFGYWNRWISANNCFAFIVFSQQQRQRPLERAKWRR